MNEIMTREAQIEERIKGRIDDQTAGQLAIRSGGGGVTFAHARDVMEFAKMMSIAGAAVPKHLRGQPGVALGVTMQAIAWEMEPFSVANKSYFVSDRLAYEAQLIHAVILRRGPIKGRPKITYDGEGPSRRCTVTFALRDEPGETVEYTSPPISAIPTKNSPLWKGDPDQQLFYYSARACARRHFPDVILGVYAVDEVEPEAPRPVPSERADAPRGLTARLDALAGAAPAEPDDTFTESAAASLPQDSAADDAGGASPSFAPPASQPTEPAQDAPEAETGADSPADANGDAGPDVGAEDVLPVAEAFGLLRDRLAAELERAKTAIAVRHALGGVKASEAFQALDSEEAQELALMAQRRIAEIEDAKKGRAE